MARRLLVQGVFRTFELAVPRAWVQYVQDLDLIGRSGLPVVVALHDQHQAPEAFQADWDFSSITLDPAADLLDRFILVQPHAVSPGLSTAPPFAPLRLWNFGWSSRGLPGVDDVAFVDALLDHVAATMQETLDQFGVQNLQPIDPDRVFLFGRGAGAMLGFRLVSELPDRFAALWSYTGAFGGRAQVARGSTGDVRYDPSGTHAVSLVHHWGEADDVVRQDGPDGTLDRSLVDQARLEAAGIPAPDARGAARGDWSAQTAIAAFNIHNGTTNSTPLAGQPDASGGTTSTRVDHVRPAGGVNPTVIEYRDPVLGHAPTVPYQNAGSAWAWFRQHPRVL